jgi:hypothetical protein
LIREVDAMRIFVSHSHDDNDWCAKFVARLAQLGADVWYDISGLNYGVDWLDAIEREIRDREVFIVVLTPSSAASYWVKKEINMAMRFQKTIVGVLLKHTTFSAWLEDSQICFAHGKLSDHVAQDVYQSLVKVAKPQANLLPPARPPTPTSDSLSADVQGILTGRPAPTPTRHPDPPVADTASADTAYAYCSVVKEVVEQVDSLGPDAKYTRVEYLRAVKMAGKTKEVVASEAIAPQESEGAARMRLRNKLVNAGWEELPGADPTLVATQYRRRIKP